MNVQAGETLAPHLRLERKVRGADGAAVAVGFGSGRAWVWGAIRS